MSFWEKAFKTYEKARSYVDRAENAVETGRAANDTAKAGAAAKNRLQNGKTLILSAEQAFHVMTIKHGDKYTVKSPSKMGDGDIEHAQWLLVESWRAYRRLSLITNAVQW
ncbi:MAG TPA: hypothetical protein VF637_10270, partial [Sphingomicrobium sp.]